MNFNAEFQTLMRIFFSLRWYKLGLILTRPKKRTQNEGSDSTPRILTLFEGLVTERPGGQANSKMDTGEIEVQLESVKSINQSQVKLPFYVKSFNEAQESLRHSFFSTTIFNKLTKTSFT